MKHSAKAVVEKMFQAFASKQIDQIVDTVSEDTHWIYHGRQVIPKSEYYGKDGVRRFFTAIINGTEIIRFQPQQFIVDNEMVVVLGNEHQRVKRSGKELKQKWVQVYTVKDELITRMEEFATTEVVT